MRTIFFLLFFAFLIDYLNAQIFAQNSDQWKATIVVRHPSGVYDSLTVGADFNAGPGYQHGLDVIDTSFAGPLAIRGHDLQIMQQYQTCPPNLSTEFKQFDHAIEYTFYIKSDEFPELYQSGQPVADSMVTIFYDTAQFNYHNPTYTLHYVKIMTFGGYMHFMDGTSNWIKFGHLYNTSFNNIPLIQEQTPNEFYGRCYDGLKIIKVILKVEFQFITGVNSLNNKITINSDDHKLIINGQIPSNSILNIYDLNGILKHSEKTQAQQQQYVINHNLSTGIYFLNISNAQYHETLKFTILR